MVKLTPVVLRIPCWWVLDSDHSCLWGSLPTYRIVPRGSGFHKLRILRRIDTISSDCRTLERKLHIRKVAPQKGTKNQMNINLTWFQYGIWTSSFHFFNFAARLRRYSLIRPEIYMPHLRRITEYSRVCVYHIHKFCIARV